MHTLQSTACRNWSKVNKREVILKTVKSRNLGKESSKQNTLEITLNLLQNELHSIHYIILI